MEKLIWILVVLLWAFTAFSKEREDPNYGRRDYSEFNASLLSPWVEADEGDPDTIYHYAWDTVDAMSNVNEYGILRFKNISKTRRLDKAWIRAMVTILNTKNGEKGKAILEVKGDHGCRLMFKLCTTRKIKTSTMRVACVGTRYSAKAKKRYPIFRIITEVERRYLFFPKNGPKLNDQLEIRRF